MLLWRFTRPRRFMKHICGYNELEKMLPGSFLRVSKSCIMNTEKIRSVRKNITGASEVEFMDSVKKAFVSRSYFKVLTDKLEEKRLKK